MKLLMVKDRMVRNTFVAVLSLIVLINYMPLIIGRLIDGYPIYNRIASLSFSHILLLFSLAIFFIILGYVITLLCGFSIELKLSFATELKFIALIYLPSLTFVIINFDRSTRYTSGGYTPILLFAYTLVSGVSVYLILRLLKQRLISRLIPFLLKMAFLTGQFMLVDGVGPALVLLLMIVLLFDIFTKNYFLLIFASLIFIAWSFYFKYQGSLSFDLLKDVIWRLAIRMESFINHLSGDSTINTFSTYINYYWGWLQDRLGFIYAGEIKVGSTYKSLSDSIFQDLYRGVVDLGFVGGSSPGIFYWWYLTYGGVIFGGFAFYFVLKNYIALSRQRDIFYVVLVAYLVNEIVSDVSEVVLILSPAFIYFMLFVIASFVVAKEEDYGYS